ncbi:hypothetical protein GGC65_004289 [Sphingopyxis sp. OAS728]|uniref:hypothetical protein n=1 Tax=Sphingopyxis sp. OAS728 TaxID=2663823 RepID=UPI00178B1466|nr:hypothetical protein [Sphingopyxis sp. OAS728]MBE1529833.1 hypothetical protein [Sphingopyxis sp. OAS728]
MTFMIILGAAAAVYLTVLMFRLAALALPLYAGIGAGIWLHTHGYGYGASIAAGLLTGLIVLGTGRMISAAAPPLLGTVVALTFALPAGVAGYQAAKGLAGLLLAEGALLECLGAAGAVTAAVSAWRSLVGTQRYRSEEGVPLGA